MDNFIQFEATEIAWKELQEKQINRAYDTCVRLLKTPLSLEEFRNVWYSQKKEDKSGKNHIANMCMSLFQSRKVSAGNVFEKIIEKIHNDNQIKTYNQYWVDSDGNISKNKPKNTSVHKHDCLIPFDDSTNIKDMIVISKKTTLRDRFREDLDSVSKCKKLIYLTKEIPSKGLIDSIVGYNCIIVYPNSLITENTWSYSEYIRKLQHFQKTGSYNST